MTTAARDDIIATLYLPEGNRVKKSLGFALCAGVLALLAACSEQPAQPASASQAPAEQASDNDVTCAADDVTGSLIHKKIECSTQQQRDQQVEAARSASTAR
jgi:hypothetical protein